MASPVSSLTLVPVEALVLHEQTDPSRVDRVRESLVTSQSLRHPILATPMGDGRWVVLDGAHRASALRACAVPVALVQQVDLPRGARLEAWAHLISGCPWEVLLAEPSHWMVSGVRRHDLQDRYLARVVGARATAFLYAQQGDHSSVVEALWTLANRYYERYVVERVATARWSRPPEGALLVEYRRFMPDELIALVRAGHVLPPGVTRFIVPGRILNVNISLDQLREMARSRPEGSWKSLVHRLEAHPPRYYAEPVYVFE